MEAVYFERHGGPEVLRYGQRPTPRPGPNQVLIEVHAVGVNPRDWMLRQGTYVGRYLVGRPPIIPGSDVSGVVVEVGAKVEDFAVGDEVFSMQSQLGHMGGYAQYMAVNASCVALKPPAISHIEAAAVPVAGLTAWQSLFGIARISAGSKVVVVGASGGVGHYAVQLASHAGAHVTAVCSAANAEFVRGLGAAAVVDYTEERFTDVVSGQDLVFDTLGRESLDSCRNVLARDGLYITTVPNLATFARWAQTSLRSRVLGGQRASVIAVKARGQELSALAELMAQGHIRSVVDSVYPLAEAAEAHRKSRTFRTRGKLVLQVRD
ncbi:NADP-dependent oxidoreductase [Hoyosella subflava]|uniref:Alcohol dehydrogenase zinc-binding domain protein n=1 Tax=Hoyosella subflava (strain DSM 45089 / JCM 17490 / NBRC 109087 / DQS3-9A1) TaxID=443218 RepID=F6ER41_HOYSD|nr:NADP-dependent oxidoreductase [Hoyosella subflava]AEF40728.1 Alcohol dehydrogenase zinc-binding domain protein [Hoyosella subflava DQS3-9A1]